MNKNKWIKNICMTLGVFGAFLTLSESSFAHGYIQNSRVHLSHLGINQNAGPAQYEPQSIEALGNFPLEGPADGQIAGAGKYHELDAQSIDRWEKISMNGGKNSFTWTLTAPHRTDEWKYYITKADWDPNSPLTRDDLELIYTKDDNGAMPASTVTHSFDLPTDRDGYHLILGVWEIEDTVNAFYQVMDIELNNDSETPEDLEAPSIPQELVSVEQTPSSVTLNWAASTDNVGVHHYDIYRDGIKVNTTQATSMKDTGLQPNTQYTYTITAVDASGNTSAHSTALTVTTSEIPAVDTEAPSAPSHLHSMGETSSSIDLHWNAATDNVAVDHYVIYRDGNQVTTTTNTRYMDTNLAPSTTYAYTVIAVDEAGNTSTPGTLIVSTSEASTAPTTWSATTVYLEGDTVLFEGIEYTAKWWTQGEQPGIAEVWKADHTAILPWAESRAYSAGDRVSFEGATYEAKWWSQGESPANSPAWQIVNN